MTLCSILGSVKKPMRSFAASKGPVNRISGVLGCIHLFVEAGHITPHRNLKPKHTCSVLVIVMDKRAVVWRSSFS